MSRSAAASRGIPSSRSLMMLRWISLRAAAERGALAAQAVLAELGARRLGVRRPGDGVLAGQLEADLGPADDVLGAVELHERAGGAGQGAGGHAPGDPLDRARPPTMAARWPRPGAAGRGGRRSRPRRRIRSTSSALVVAHLVLASCARRCRATRRRRRSARGPAAGWRPSSRRRPRRPRRRPGSARRRRTPGRTRWSRRSGGSARPVTPGWWIFTMNIVRPAVLGHVPVGAGQAHGVVGSSRRPMLQIFEPLRTKTSPSRSARVRQPARSEPPLGSERNCTHSSSPRRMAGRWRSFCSWVPTSSERGGAGCRRSGR